MEAKTLRISTRGQVSFSTNGKRLGTRPEEEAAKRAVVMTADAYTVLRFPENSCVHFPHLPMVWIRLCASEAREMKLKQVTSNHATFMLKAYLGKPFI